jgi:hypothetical protein
MVIQFDSLLRQHMVIKKIQTLFKTIQEHVMHLKMLNQKNHIFYLNFSDLH